MSALCIAALIAIAVPLVGVVATLVAAELTVQRYHVEGF